MLNLYRANGTQTDLGKELNTPDIPDPVKDTCKRKGIQYDTLHYDFLGGYWYPRDGWKGMFKKTFQNESKVKGYYRKRLFYQWIH